MTDFLISYDLISPGQHYKPVTDKIKAYGTWCKVLESLWYIQSSKTAAQIRDEVAAHADTNDKIFVTEIGPDWASRNLSKVVNDYLKEHI